MLPKRPPVLSPRDPRYWDADDLARERTRVFTVCADCRLCSSFCPAFPALFERIENRAKLREPAALDAAESDVIDGLCFQCKACHYRCPYTAQDGHPFAIDFPQLLLRQRAQRATRQACAPSTGLSLDGSSATERGAAKPSALDSVVMFATCDPSASATPPARALFQVFGHHGIRVEVPPRQACCGAPDLESGDVGAAVKAAEANLEALFPLVSRGLDVVVPSPSCSYTIKHEYPRLLGTTEARTVATHTFDAMEHVRAKLARAHRLRTDFRKPLGRVALHVPCHLRAQRIGTPGECVLRRIPETQVELIEQCAVGSAWSQTPEHAELGRRYSGKLMEALGLPTDWDAIASDCPLAARCIAEELHTDVVHTLELLNAAYGLPPTRAPRGAP